MDPALKHRLIGAAVLSALAIIFLPKLIVGHDTNNTAADVPLTMPGAPGGDFQTKELPLVTPASGVPQGGVVGMDASHPTAPASATTGAPMVDGNGAPLPAGVLATPASSIAQPTAATTAPTANPNATAATVPAVALPTTATSPISATTVPATATPAPPPPAVAAPSAPIPATSAGGHYVVSLGTYSNAANAQSLVASLKGAQLPAYAETVGVAGKSSTRVRIGPFAQRGDAEAARLKAQQVRTDMPASVTALDAATPAPDTATAPVKKPVSALGPVMPVADKPVTPSIAATLKPVVPAASTPASTPKPTATSNTAPPAMPIKPATPSPAATGRGYAVQVSAFRSEEEALTLRNKLRAAGFTAFSERVQADSGTLYRVRVGPEADHDAADRLRAQLSAKLGLSGMVVAYP